MNNPVSRTRGFSMIPVFALALAVSQMAQADYSASSDAPVFATSATLADNLKSLSGKRVTIYLKSGTSLSGTIKATGDHLLHLEKLEGKDYFDALILMQEVAAIDTRARTSGR